VISLNKLTNILKVSQMKMRDLIQMKMMVLS
jgi:predicted amino acid-binding ACT domain protein